MTDETLEWTLEENGNIVLVVEMIPCQLTAKVTYTMDNLACKYTSYYMHQVYFGEKKNRWVNYKTFCFRLAKKNPEYSNYEDLPEGHEKYACHGEAISSRSSRKSEMGATEATSLMQQFCQQKLPQVKFLR